MSIQAQDELETTEDRLGMSEEQWAQWQAYTRGYGEQDENGVDVSLLRQNLCLTPTERLRKHQKALRIYMEAHRAGAVTRLPEHSGRA